MDHHRIGNKNQQLARAIQEQTTSALQSNFPALHMKFHLYVSYPSENYDALVYYNTTHAMEEYNLTERTKDENNKFNAEMNLYGKHLYQTHEQVRKHLTNS